MGEGTRSSPAVRLLSGWAPRVARCPRQPSILWTPVWESQLPLHPERGSRTGRGKGRDEARGGAAEGRGKAGCVSGEGGVGAIMSV